MERVRVPLQGVTNIVRFNWHYYFLALSFILFMFLINTATTGQYLRYIILILFAVIGTTTVSLLVSFYVYDLSNLYTMNWLNKVILASGNKILNINAGFDETSVLLQSRYPDAELMIFDFYDSRKHTEISIERARRTYPPYPGTKAINAEHIPLQSNSVDYAYLILAAHEIRNEDERIKFFKELARVLMLTGKVIVVEHPRDFVNFLAFNIGFFHFFSKSCWHNTFKSAGFKIGEEIKITPFITAFILEKDGITA